MFRIKEVPALQMRVSLFIAGTNRVNPGSDVDPGRCDIFPFSLKFYIKIFKTARYVGNHKVPDLKPELTMRRVQFPNHCFHNKCFLLPQTYVYLLTKSYHHTN